MININRTQEVGVVLRLQVRKEELNRAQEPQTDSSDKGKKQVGVVKTEGTAAGGMCWMKESEFFVETVVNYLLDSRSLEDLQLLLTQEETWKLFVAGVDLSREEEAALGEALAGIFADPDGEDEDELQNDLQDKNKRKEDDALSEALGETLADADAEDEEELADADAEDEEELADADAEDEEELADAEAEDEEELAGAEAEDEEELADADAEDEEELADADAEDEEELADAEAEDEEEIQNDLWDNQMFLDAYPQVKLELEECIRKLHALADKVDKVHRDCTISQVVASSSSAVSGVLTILGLALAPVTAGVSLALSATGLGLEAAAAVTSVSTSIVEKVSMVSAEAEARKLVPTNKDTKKGMKDVLELSGTSLVSLSVNFFKNLENIKKNIHAIKLTKANPRLANNAKRLMATETVSVRKTKEVQKAFGGTALAMTKGARILGAATAGFSLLLDVVSLVQDSKHLHDGAKTEFAEEMRQQARDLERKLQELIRVQDNMMQ
uniref:apolipoprotein L6-like n=1 Tax=Arvicanthis niloticus TaxID=61156 RepID=UPI001486A9D8|nr:apolipoprotein L6-like [Arvicanthis niloticus]